MWKAVVFLACASLVVIVATDGETGDTGDNGDTRDTGDTSYTDFAPQPQSTGYTSCGCGIKCGRDQVYTDFKDRGCTPLRCSELGFPINANITCRPGCVCKDSLLFAADGTCISRDKCPSCGGDPNAESGCGSNCGKTCATYLNKPLRCPIGCIFNGCNCKDGFVFDPNVKRCVLPKQCTPTCGKNEVFSNCTNGGCDARKCSQVGSHVPCVKLDPKSCIKGCVCQPGYLRAANGTCVPKNQCDQGCGGDLNAHPGCGVNCGKTCSSYKAKAQICPHICKVNGCDCNDGYVFDPNVGKCVRPKDCTPTCGLNEVYTSCVNGGCGHRNCSQLGKPILCIDPIKCIGGCICQPNYLRASSGTCVPQNQCNKPKCPKNEVFDFCPAPCPPRRCDVDDRLIRCAEPPKPGSPDCHPACRCRDNYARNSKGICVPRSQCDNPKCTGQNEYFDPCISGCTNQTCSDIGKKINCPLQSAVCRKGCRCNPGFYRNADNVCVPQSQCPSPPCPDGEIYSWCPTVKCEGDYCPKNRNSPLTCPVGIVCDPPRCVCGFNRRRDRLTGKCILASTCPSIPCGKNEEFKSCPANCPGEKCSDYINKTKCPPFRIGIVVPCVPQCKCKQGYYRNSNGACILGAQCAPTCGKNEVLSNCTNGGCDARNCSQVGSHVPCVKLDPKFCIKGCVCQPDYLRAANGTCVPKNQCDQGCGGDLNAHPGCGVNCGKTCSTYKAKAPICPRICKVNGCDCNDGYVFDPNVGKCVRPKDCTPTCGLNEVYTSCVNGGCGHRNCSQLGKPILCIDPIKCIGGCICQPNYLRASNGTCVPQNQCNKPKCPKNEVFDFCPAPCPPRRCDVDDRLIRCAAPPKPGSPDCRPACRCRDNYARNSKGICVPRSQCDNPKPCPANEVFDNCPGTCPPQKCGINPALILCAPNPKPGDAACKPGCKCVDGYVRNSTEVCIPKDQCPPCNGPNEFFNLCISGCSSQSCIDIGKDVECLIQPAICRTGCVCNPGYRRNADNVCTPESECPKCTGQNEYFDTCISGCTNQSCSDIGKIFHCPIQKVCRSGCRCNSGYFRNANNVCVAQSECPPANNCTGQNEYYDPCFYDCSNQTCDNIGKSYSCPAQVSCKAGCRCKTGFWRDSNGVCISESACPTPPCPDGEIYSWCPTVKCEGDYCPKNRNSPLTCPVGIVCDPPRCVCGFNRRRDRLTGKCIVASTCPSIPCGKNEEFKSCPASCPGETCSDYINKSKCPRFRIGIVVPCVPQCRCKQGYYRNSDRDCIIGAQCEINSTTPRPPVIITPTGNSTTCIAEGIASLQAAVTSATGKALVSRMKSAKGENLIMSIFSVFTPLAQLALYAIGVSLQQLLSILNLKSKDDIRTIFPAWTASFANHTGGEFDTASKVYANKLYSLSDLFKKDSVEIFHAEGEDLDFSNPELAAAIINAWVENKTNHRIKDLVPASSLSSLTRIVLVNAIYFKYKWKYQFNVKNTLDNQDFYLSDGTTKKTKLMYQEATFKYGEDSDLDCKYLEMPYVDEQYSMFIALPNKVDGVEALAEKLSDPTNYNKAYSSLRSQKVKVWLPPWKTETTTNLKELLSQLGIIKIFDSSDSGLDGMLKNPEPVSITAAIQKAFIEVNEEGSEAAAANAIAVGGARPSLPPPPPPEFRADHPFLFYIRVNSTTIFSGTKCQ